MVPICLLLVSFAVARAAGAAVSCNGGNSPAVPMSSSGIKNIQVSSICASADVSNISRRQFRFTNSKMIFEGEKERDGQQFAHCGEAFNLILTDCIKNGHPSGSWSGYGETYTIKNLMHPDAYKPKPDGTMPILSKRDGGTYTVVPGDFLFEIAQKLGVSLTALEACNPQVTNPALIFPGQVLNIPGSGTSSYTVQAGDFMFEIAQKFGISLDALERSNPQVTNPALIFPGQVLTIPVACGNSGTSTMASGSSTASSSGPSISSSGSSTTSSSRSSISPPGSSTTPSSRPSISSSGSSPTPSSRPSISSSGSSTTPSSRPSISSSSSQSSNLTTSPTITSSRSVTTTSQSSTAEVVIIGGSTITIGAASSVTVVGNQTLTIGPGRIVGPGGTISIPTSVSQPTVITSNGVTLTLEPGLPPISISSPDTSIEPLSSGTAIVVDGITYDLGSYTLGITGDDGQEFTIGPGGIAEGSDTISLPISVTKETIISTDGLTFTVEPISTGTSIVTTGPPISVTVVVIGSLTLTIGTEDVTSTVTAGGETLQIGLSGVVIGGSTTISPPGSTTITTDGITLGFAPTLVPDPEPLSLPGSASSLIADAQLAIVAYASASAAVSGLAQSGASSVGNAEQLRDILLTTFNAFDTVQEDITALDADTSTLSPATLLQLTNVRSEIQAIKKMIKSNIQDIVDALTNNGFPLTKRYQRILGRFLATTGTYLALKLFFSVVAGSESGTPSVPQPGSTTNSSAPPQRSEWVMMTNPGTNLLDFERLIKTLPDAGTGDRIVFDGVNFQGYVTQLNRTEAILLNMDPIVKDVALNVAFDSPSFGVIPGGAKRHSKREGNVIIDQQEDSPRHLKRISQSPQNLASGVLSNYIYESTLGEGVTIYIMDSGFLKDTLTGQVHQDFEANPPPYSFVTSKDRSIKNGLADILNHGECVASVAAGQKYGVAKRATLVPVKYKESNNAQFAAILETWMWVNHDVFTRGFQGKAILSMSAGFERARMEDASINYDDLFQILLLPLCNLNEITVVVAAGNGGQRMSGRNLTPDRLQDFSPQWLGGRNEPLIIVGAVNEEGDLWTETTGGATGPDVFAQALVVCAHPFDFTGVKEKEGTSFAAPAVAGLAAYFLSHPTLGGRFLPPNTASKVKNFISGLAHPRAQDAPPFAYNNIHADMCQGNSPVVQERQIQIDPNFSSVEGSFPESTIEVSGNIIATSFVDMVCGIRPTTASSTTTSSTSKSTSRSSSRTTTLSFTSSNTASSSAPSNTAAPPITASAPPAATACGDNHLETPSPVVTQAITVPSGTNVVEVFIPFANVAGSSWDIQISEGLVVNPKTLITFWQVDNGIFTPFTNGAGAAPNDITWTNQDGGGNTKLTLIFQHGLGIVSFGIVIIGQLPCTPPAATTTTPPTPDCTGPIPTVPVSIPSIPQDLHCQGSALAPRADCLGLLPRLPQGTNGGITSADCISGSQGTNSNGQLFCRLADSGQCSVVITFGKGAENVAQSRSDIAAIINDSNMYCFRVCETGPLEGSSILNQDNDVAICIMDTSQADLC